VSPAGTVVRQGAVANQKVQQITLTGSVTPVPPVPRERHPPCGTIGPLPVFEELRDDLMTWLSIGRVSGRTEDSRVSVAQAAIHRQVAIPRVMRPLESLSARDDDTDALIDALTGLPSRRQIESALEIRLDNLRRYGWRFGMLLIDIDEFMAVNDRYGQEAGDRALCEVARTVLRGTRPGDYVARWGGDEFVVLVNGVDGAGLHAAAERIRALVSGSIVRAVEAHFEVRASVGGALAFPQDGWFDVFARADAALYRAKRDGRDRVAVRERR
jgi:diguanylate cyclase (GGDEF)-like protein